MVVHHEYHPDLCERDNCSLCDAYGAGYFKGKLAAYTEVRARLRDDTHAPDCGCEPCLLIRAARSSGPAHRRVRVKPILTPPPPAQPVSEPLERLCVDCDHPFLTPRANPDVQQCEFHREFSRPRKFSEPREAL